MRQTILVVIGGVVLMVLVVKELLDLAATFDYIEQKFPRLVKWAERKAWQRVLLIVLTVLYAGILYEMFAEREVEIVNFPSADTGAKDAQIAELRRRSKEPPEQVRNRTIDLDKLKYRALAAAEQLSEVVREKQRIENTLTGENERKQFDEDCARVYHDEFEPKVLAIAKDLKDAGYGFDHPPYHFTCGFEVKSLGMMDQCAAEIRFMANQIK